jgi:hypothetical protein
MIRPLVSALVLLVAPGGLACSTGSSVREPAASSPPVESSAASPAAGAAPVGADGTSEPPSPELALPPAAALPAVEALPDPFAFSAGGRVIDRADWSRRRGELRRLMQHYEYGELPEGPERVDVAASAGDSPSQRQLTVTVSTGGRSAAFPLRVRVPPGAGPFPTFIGAGALNDPLFLSRGFAVAELELPRIAGDDASRSGVFYSLYPDSSAGVLAAWAWGFSRAVDALASLREVNAAELAVTGHSRNGKAALLAGALDGRIALTVPAASGLGGTGNYRFFYEAGGKNEKIENITARFPYWFSPRLQEFVGRPERLPFDQHALMALVAPRLLLTTIGTEDHWANPRGTQLTHLAAQRVYQFLGAPDRIGIHYRPGGHPMTDQDFTAMLDYADLHWRGKKPSSSFDGLPYPEEPRAMPWAALVRDPG